MGRPNPEVIPGLAGGAAVSSRFTAQTAPIRAMQVTEIAHRNALRGVGHAAMV
jgi:hypothetical protein